MSRRHLTFQMEDSECAATLDAAAGTSGLLIVSGGTELRSGPAAVNSRLAARIAALGYPVLRYDRRGIGDSEGDDPGFRGAAPDFQAALAAFRSEQPQIERIIAFGNCDAASLLMLQQGVGCDALALGNPWSFDTEAEQASPNALRAHYRQRLKSGSALKRLLSGKVSLRTLAGSLGRMTKPAARPTPLAEAMFSGVGGFEGTVQYLISGRDRTGLSFQALLPKGHRHVGFCEGATHAFVEPESLDWLERELLKLLER